MLVDVNVNKTKLKFGTQSTQIKFDNMEVKQETNEETCKIEIDNEEFDGDGTDGTLDDFNIEIKVEPKREPVYKAFDYLDFPEDTKVEEDEYKFNICEETQTTNEESLRPNEIKMKSNKTSITHTGEKSYKCEVCFKQFRRAGNFKKHLQIHTGEKPYNCEICFKQFGGAGSLKRHLRIHTGEKPYKCEICFKPFVQAGALKIHLRIHTGEKPFKCDICFKQFSEAGTLKKL
ncbi:zinc finger protein 468-like isoform X2 [Diabrotica virgifera virgifera]|uniref:C2H2-type domain-containing protein n=1 Tax=Diabrotica virgifera virgifera TaxID=50390 RepID=A0ABM5JM64_DIAVI|nr:zinc finger protein 468-like isoform X2 [Diabrotica virgifera virgifera]